MTPLPLKRILVPTDLSDCARPALAHARLVAEQADAELILLHVIDPATFDAYNPPTAYAVHEGIIRKRMEILERTAQETSQALKVRCSVVTGNVAGEIIHQARCEEADLIVMSTHGLTGFRRWLLGSIAERVVRTASCPVLTVKPQGEEATVPAAYASSPRGQ